jgi:cbb3-type cytochrome oxidase subunit 3
MTTGAIVTTIVMWVIFIGALWFCFSQMGKGGKWED